MESNGNGRRFEGEAGARLKTLERSDEEQWERLEVLDGRIRQCETMTPCMKWRDDVERRLRKLEAAYWAVLGVFGLVNILWTVEKLVNK